MKLVTRLIILVLFSSALPAAAQDFSVVSTTPAPGDSSVALQTTVTFTFSAPVDTSARFDGGGPLAFFTISPRDSIRIDSSFVSADLTEFSFDVSHRDGTDYVWVLTGARSQDGALLCRQAVVTYTTAQARGSAIVRGWTEVVVLVKNGSCYSGGVAALLDAPPGPGAEVVAAAEVDEMSTFRLSGVRPGRYWPILLLDWNLDGRFSPDWNRAGNVESEVGVYDPDFDGSHDSLDVTDTTNVQIVLRAGGSSSIEGGAELPGTARLLQNYPNPFSGSTRLVFELERPLQLSIVIYDLLGRQIARPAGGLFLTGRNEIEWKPGEAAGFYIVRLESPGFVLARPIIIVP